MNTSQLTFTRFIAAVAIVFFHYHHGIFTTNIKFIEQIKNNFDLGVSYFYVLSGFVMMLAYGNKPLVNSRSYYINRFARIYPLHIFSSITVIIVSILVSLNYLEYYHFPPITILLEHIFLVQAWIPQDALSLNLVSWSISVEAFFYICFPILFKNFIQKNSLKVVSFVILSFWLICQIVMNWFFLSPFFNHTPFSIENSFLRFNPFLHLNQFCIGLLFGKYFVMNYTNIQGKYDVLIIFFALITLLLIYYLRNMFVQNGLLAINFAILISLISANQGFLTKFFRNKFLIYMGEISFAIYLLQGSVYDLSLKIFKAINIVNPYVVFFTSFIVLVMVAHFSFKWIEIPFKNKIRNKLSI